MQQSALELRGFFTVLAKGLSDRLHYPQIWERSKTTLVENESTERSALILLIVYRLGPLVALQPVLDTGTQPKPYDSILGKAALHLNTDITKSRQIQDARLAQVISNCIAAGNPLGQLGRVRGVTFYRSETEDKTPKIEDLHIQGTPTHGIFNRNIIVTLYR